MDLLGPPETLNWSLGTRRDPHNHHARRRPDARGDRAPRAPPHAPPRAQPRRYPTREKNECATAIAKEYRIEYHSTKPLIPPRVHEHVTPQNDPHQPPRLHIVRSTRDRPFDAITARWREAALCKQNTTSVELPM